MAVVAGIAKFERDLIRERTGSGRKASMKRGVKFGRPKKLSLDKQKLTLRLVDEGKSIRQIAKTFDVNRSALQIYHTMYYTSNAIYKLFFWKFV